MSRFWQVGDLGDQYLSNKVEIEGGTMASCEPELCEGGSYIGVLKVSCRVAEERRSTLRRVEKFKVLVKNWRRNYYPVLNL